MSRRGRAAPSALAALALAACGTAQARAIDEVRVSRSGDEATIEIELGCAMQYDSHAPSDGSGDLRIALTLGYDCRLALRTEKTDLRHPVGGRMANLFEIAFETDERTRGWMTLRFTSPVRCEIGQTSNRYLLTVTVLPGTPAQQRQAPPEAVSQPAAGAAIVQSPRPSPPPSLLQQSPRQTPEPDRRPLRKVRTLPSSSPDRFVIRVAELDESQDVGAETPGAFPSHIFYAYEVSLGARTMTELRLGFFEDEEAARRALAVLGSRFGSAWIAVADPGEQALAREHRIVPRAMPPAAVAATLDAPEDADAADPADTVESLSEERVAALMSEARSALVRRDYEKSIALHARLLRVPVGAHRQEARELLGVALEKSGRPARARAEYETWLAEFPHADAGDANRVRQRLAALAAPAPGDEPLPGRVVAVADAPAAGDAARETTRGAAWDLYGSASQYYLRGVSLAPGDHGEDVVAQSALLSQALLFARRSGERFDITSRANVAYLHDFVDDGEEEPENQALVSYAWVDVADSQTNVSARLGRQRQETGAALGRFDGIQSSYRWRPDVVVHASVGLPVDSPRFRATGDHWFYGAGLDLENFVGDWNLSVFTNLQTIDGIPDRRAVGTELKYQGQRVNVVGLVDFDASYNVLNTAFVTGNWRLNDRLTVHGRLRGGAAPFLTTRNALIGQPTATVRELFPDYSEGQIRRLARNRTARERAGAAGLSAALTPRLQLKADVAWSELDATPASGGVAAFPETGPQVSWGGHLLGSGFFRAGHLILRGSRHDETRRVDTETVFIDLRQPLGERLRLQSRLDLSFRVADQDPAGDVEQWVAQPLLRVAYDWRRRYRVELEAGGRWSNRKFPQALTPPLVEDDSIEYSDYYLQLGYILDF